MARLSSDQVYGESKTRDSAAIESLTLTHRALSDVSCLSSFKNLWKLDLKLNNLTSLESLKSCTNLKWLSVAENKLETLKGIEALSKLTVLNAGKNKLKSMEEVRSITSLCALILNDNEITSICMLDQMKDLNTLVLSKNPIGEIGQSLVKSKSLKKLSLSHCQLTSINNSLKSCVELKELRLAHNDITSLPAELAHNKCLLNLDLGNNAITRWSDLKVLSSLVILRNLNLQGNPIAEEEKLTSKKVLILPRRKDCESSYLAISFENLITSIKKTLPKLNVLNAKSIDKHSKNEKLDKNDKYSSLSTEENLETRAVNLGEHDKDGNEFDKKSKRKAQQMNQDASEENVSLDDEKSKLRSTEKTNKAQKRKSQPIVEKAGTESKPKRSSKGKRSELDVIDDGEASFAELLNTEKFMEESKYKVEKVNKNGGLDKKSMDGVVSLSLKKKVKGQSKYSGEERSTAVEVGMGGESTWGDE